jgi:hypothetical protein
MTWNIAKSTSPEYEQYTWTFWEYAWNITNPGHYFVLARAYDSKGNLQPKAAPWNAKGYGNNSIHTVTITVPRVLY